MLNFNVKCIWLRKILKWKSTYRAISQWIRDNNREKFVFVSIHIFFHLMKGKICENSNFSKYVIYMCAELLFNPERSKWNKRAFSHFTLLFVEFSKNTLGHKSEGDPKRKRGREIKKGVAVITWVNYLRNRRVELTVTDKTLFFLLQFLQFCSLLFHIFHSIVFLWFPCSNIKLVFRSQFVLHAWIIISNLIGSAPLLLSHL